MSEGLRSNLLDRVRARLAFSKTEYGDGLPRWEREMRLIKEYCETCPASQFFQQMDEEKRRILANESPRFNSDRIAQHAYDTVKSHWVDQGIWNDKWDKENNGLPCGTWKHEEPVGPSTTDLDVDFKAGADDLAPDFFEGNRASEKPAGMPTNLLAQIRAAEQHDLQKRQREASRPFHQFVHQVSLERERLRKDRSILDIYPSVESQVLQVIEQSTGAETFYVPLTQDMTRADINTMAYDRVKQAWMDRGIWDWKWGVLPGMAWKHEKPLEEFLTEEMRNEFPGDGAVLGDNGHGTWQFPGLRTAHLFSSTQTDRPGSGYMNNSQKHPSDTPGNLGYGAGGASPREHPFQDPSNAESHWWKPQAPTSRMNAFQNTPVFMHAGLDMPEWGVD